MKFLVVYFSRGGKTRKVAEAIAKQLECEAVDVEKEAPDVAGVELLIVGSSEYLGKLHKTLQSFLDGLQPSNKSKAAVFATAAGPNPKVVYVLKRALEAKGYMVVSSFKCRGRFLFFNWSHPNEKDLENARAFANDLKKISDA
ncbi:MAG: flavodoxin [Candidatus Bathyarchaeota archaeon]|nr:MAG: flavodoxin [Candidatus Bathyarchaeota archaeon]